MKRLLLALFAVSLVTTAFAHRDRLGRISRAEFTFEDGGTVVITEDRTAVLSVGLQTDAGTWDVRAQAGPGKMPSSTRFLGVKDGRYRFVTAKKKEPVQSSADQRP